jgi:hypothetical protein
MKALPFNLPTLALNSSSYSALTVDQFLLPDGIEMLARSAAAQRIWQLGCRPEIRTLVSEDGRGAHRGQSAELPTKAKGESWRDRQSGVRPDVRYGSLTDIRPKQENVRFVEFASVYVEAAGKGSR